MSVVRCVAAAFAVLIGLGASSASAWTRTVVHSADATVDVADDASMDVLMKLTVEVHAGWLHELELAGLGDRVTLDLRRPPYLLSEDGETHRPDATVTEDGHIRLSFKRRGAPRKGEYRAIVRYRTQGDVRPLGGTQHDRARISWTLPAWETGLHDVSVDIRAPKGAAVPIELQDRSPGVELTTTDRAKVTQIEWRRIHLPRHTPWTLTFDVPADSVALPPAPPTKPAPSGFHALELDEERPLPWALAVVAFLVLLKRRSLEALVGQAGLLVRLPWPAVLAVSIGLVGIGGWLAANALVCAIPLLPLASQRTLPLGRTRETRLGALLDATTPSGLGVATVLSITLVSLAQPLAALILLPVFLTGTRYHRAPTVAEATNLLRAFMLDLRVPEGAPAMAFRWEKSQGASPTCRVVLPKERAGLMRLAFVTTARTSSGVATRSVMLLIETRAQSDADDLARRRIGIQPSFRTPDGRVGRLVEWDLATLHVIRALACSTATEPVRASRGTWLLREITGRQREAA